MIAHSCTSFKARQLTLDNLQRVYVNLGFKLAVPSVKMGRRVIVEEHSDQNAVELTNRGHRASPESFSPHQIVVGFALADHAIAAAFH